jgi:hypothetical protein
MAGVRFTALQSRPMAFLDFTSLTLDEFQQLVVIWLIKSPFLTHKIATTQPGKGHNSI